MQKLLILEEQLSDAKSHHFSYYKCILSAARNAGVETALYVNKRADESVCRRLQAMPVMLTMAGLSASGAARVKNRCLRFCMLVKNLIGNFFICRSALNSFQKTDTVLCLSTWIPHVLLFVLLALVTGQKMPNAGLLFVWYPKLGAKPTNSFLFVRLLVQLLHRIHRKTFIFAETTYAQKAWQEFLGLPVRYVVHPVDIPEEVNRREVEDGQYDIGTQSAEAKIKADCDGEKVCAATSASPNISLLNAKKVKPLVFGFYGFARHEQGVDVLMRALEILKSQGEWVSEFRIVWPQAFQMPDGSWLEPKMFEHLTDKVRFFEKALSPQEYLKQLSETDWLVLPYRVRSYQGRCSRISIEASVLGIPVIYSNGTDLEEVVTNHGAGIPVGQENPEDLSDSICKASTENLGWKINALDKRMAARHYFSGRSFIDEIICQRDFK